MLRAQPDRHAITAWLRVVAIHEADRLLAIERREAKLRGVRIYDGHSHDVAVDPRTLDDAVEALEARRIVASLPQRQRNDVALKLAGYSYEEIRARIRGRTMTNVATSLRKARRRICRSRAGSGAVG